MTCSTCNGRGWLPRFEGDQHGDLCLDCTDPALLDGPAAKRRPDWRVDAHWTEGKARSGSGVVVRLGTPRSRRSRRRAS